MATLEKAITAAPTLEATRLSDDVVIFDRDQCAAAGTALHASYAAADPFPHIVIENFIDADVLRSLLEEWPSTGQKVAYDRAQERLKYEWQPAQLRSPRLRAFLAELNAEPMLRFVEALTGIEKLIADPYYSGGGLHETRAGGHLGIHADFNVHAGLNLLRRVNLLIYLNDDWQPEWNGNLELWNRSMTERRVAAAPSMATAVVFNTDLDSFHGVPDPVACPPDRSRRSIAMYYYTAAPEGLAAVPKRTTTFKNRPASTDRIDWKVGARHLMQDLMPPALYRALKRKNR